MPASAAPGAKLPVKAAPKPPPVTHRPGPVCGPDGAPVKVPGILTAPPPRQGTAPTQTVDVGVEAVRDSLTAAALPTDPQGNWKQRDDADIPVPPAPTSPPPSEGEATPVPAPPPDASASATPLPGWGGTLGVTDPDAIPYPAPTFQRPPQLVVSRWSRSPPSVQVPAEKAVSPAPGASSQEVPAYPELPEGFVRDCPYLDIRRDVPRHRISRNVTDPAPKLYMTHAGTIVEEVD